MKNVFEKLFSRETRGKGCSRLVSAKGVCILVLPERAFRCPQAPSCTRVVWSSERDLSPPIGIVATLEVGHVGISEVRNCNSSWRAAWLSSFKHSNYKLKSWWIRLLFPCSLILTHASTSTSIVIVLICVLHLLFEQTFGVARLEASAFFAISMITLVAKR